MPYKLTTITNEGLAPPTEFACPQTTWTFVALILPFSLILLGCSSRSLTEDHSRRVREELRKGPDSTTVFIEVDELPSPIGGIRAIVNKLRYPLEARRKKIGGTVILLCTIDTNGEVIEVTVVSGIGFGCDEAAIEAVRATKFHPGKYDGRPVITKTAIPLLFRLSR